MMNVLFLNPPLIDRFSRTVRRSPDEKVYCPVWLAYSAGVVEEAGHIVKLVDAPLLPHYQGLFREEDLFMPDFTPNFIVIETSSNSIYNDFEVAKHLKSFYPESFIIMVGAFVSALGKKILELNEYVDAVAVGEYEYTIRDLANKKPIDEIPGLILNGAETTMKRQPIENLDELPLVSLIYKSHLNMKNYPSIGIITSRGCPHKCTFCVNPQVMHGHKYRAMSPEKVVEEFEFIEKYFPGMDVSIEDDCFSIDKERVKKICELLIQKDLLLRWSCNVRADLKYELLGKMKEAGCYKISVGFESASQEVLDNIQKDITNVRKYKGFVINAKMVGLCVEACFMLGNKGETEDTATMTSELVEELDCSTKGNSTKVYPLFLYPGTKAYEWAAENKYLKKDILSEWLNEDGLYRGILNNPALPPKRLVELSYASNFHTFKEIFKKGLHRCR